MIFNPNNISYRSENTHRVHDSDQLVNAVQANDRFVF